MIHAKSGLSGSPGKAAFERFVEIIRSARINRLWSACPSIRSVDLLHALADPDRANLPRAAQLREAAQFGRELRDDLSKAVTQLEQAAAECRIIGLPVECGAVDVAPEHGQPEGDL